MSLWRRISGFVDSDGRAALVTIVEAKGSTPREAGARMVVRADGAFIGTIGGGALEHAMLTTAREMMADAAAPPAGRTLRQVLGPDLGQCCGGVVTLRIEVFQRSDMPWIRPLALVEQRSSVIDTVGRPDAQGRLVRRLAGRAEKPPESDEIAERFGEALTHLVLFGAGHVGRALVMALAPLPFVVTWVDGRPEAFPEVAPPNVRMRRAADPGSVLTRLPPETLVLVMTHSHALDLDIVSRALAAPGVARVGLIGSASKRARFSGLLRQAGLAEAAVDRLICPIGSGGPVSKHPAVIAAAVAVELLTLREESLARQAAQP